MGMMESIYSFLKFSPYLKQKENYLGPTPYCDFKRQAQNQRALWLIEVKTPHYPVDFEELNELIPLSEEPNWFGEVANLAVNPPHCQLQYGYTIYPFDKGKALELLAAFSFLDISILEEQVPLTNFKWACPLHHSSCGFVSNPLPFGFSTSGQDVAQSQCCCQLLQSRSPRF
ncbi:hypothetical protein RHMOL_Rhmol01G0250600 [Rhododendron molle]|uniref:Uncharacterized protein n=1 Tax=Rhododendron molle TaxID=49168 RepID=A0ACC0Q6M5_RHOML|nr:hypothetical protein RHMOL_Rhmol01G0250600 [Rhododendron molle]